MLNGHNHGSEECAKVSNLEKIRGQMWRRSSCLREVNFFVLVAGQTNHFLYTQTAKRKSRPIALPHFQLLCDIEPAHKH